MSNELAITAGQYSSKGRKDSNQDFHGMVRPSGVQLGMKGIAIALADGISSSEVSHIASESAVSVFLEDYYCTSDTWSVKKSAERVLAAINAWLYSQTQQSRYRYDKDRGYVCTFSAIIIKSTTAHIFHVGDTRIYRMRDNSLEQLTRDHRVWVSQEQSYLSRALGINQQLELDYQTVQVELGDVFLLASDGVYEYTEAHYFTDTIKNQQDDLELAAQHIVEHAYEQGSDDNLSLQIIRIDSVPTQAANEVLQQLTALKIAPILEARMDFDGYKIIREIHGSSRSHLYLATEVQTNTIVTIKTPSIDLQGDPAYMERFLMEEWIARRINNAHVLKPCAQQKKRNYVYVVTEFIDGQTLRQWMIDNTKPKLEEVRGIVEQIAKGLQAFHRLEMLHQDIRPDNIMIDRSGTVKIIDFGSTRVAGIVESSPLIERIDILGTAQYTAPEYFLGENGTSRSDIYSLGVITYQMLTGHLPYGAQVAKSMTKSAQKKLSYRSALDDDLEIPVWIDDVIKKSVDPDPYQRYEELSEFIADLRQPSRAFLNKTRPPLLERNPLMFWKISTGLLSLLIVGLLGYISMSR